MADMKMQMTLELKAKIDEANAAVKTLENIKKAIEDTNKTFEKAISNANEFMSKMAQLANIKLDIKLPDRTFNITPVLDQKSIGAVNEQLKQIPPPTIKINVDLEDAKNKIKTLSEQQINIKAKVIIENQDYLRNIQGGDQRIRIRTDTTEHDRTMQRLKEEQLQQRIRISADLGDYKRVQEQLKNQILDTKVRIIGDKEQFDRQANQIKTTTLETRARITADTEQYNRQTQQIKTQTLQQRATVDLDTAQAKLETQNLRNQLLTLQAQKIQLQIDTTRARNEWQGFHNWFNNNVRNISLGNIVAGAFTAGISAAMAAIQALIEGVKNSLKTFAQYETSLKGLASVSKAFSQSQSDAEEAARSLASDGLIPLSRATSTLKNLISTGYTLQQAFELSKAMKDIGAFNNVVGDLGEAMDISSRGLRMNSIELIDNIGFTKRLSSVLKERNIDISNGISLSDNAAQRQAVFNAFMDEAAKNTGNATEYAKTYAGAVAQTSTSIKEMQNSLGSLLSGAGIAWNKWLKLEADSLKTILDYLKEINIERQKSQSPVQFIESKGGIKSLSDSEIKEMQENLKSKIEKGINTLDLKYVLAPWTIDFDVKNLEKAKQLLEESGKELRQREIDARSAAEFEPKRQQRQLVIAGQEKLKELSSYLEGINKNLDTLETRYKDVGKTFEEITDAKINMLKSETEKLDVTSDKYLKLKEILAKLNIEKVKIDFEKDLKKSIDEHIQESLKGEIGKNIYQIEVEVLYKGKVSTQTVPLEESGYYKPTGAGSSGVDYGTYYGKMAYEAQKAQQSIDVEKLRQQRISNRKFEAEQQDYYNNLKKISKDESEKLKKETQYKLEEARKNIASEITNIGNVLNNDFIKALGTTVNNIISLQDNLTKYKATTGLAQVSAGLGIAGAVVSIGATIFGLFNNSAEKQMSAAEKMAEAVSKFEESIKDKTAQEAGKETGNLLTKLNTLLKGVSAMPSALPQTPGIYSYKVGEKTYTGFKEGIQEQLKLDIDIVKQQLSTLKDTIKEKLGFTWENLASSVKSAFDEANLADFQASFKKSLTKTIRDSVVEGFLTGDIMKGKMTALSDSIYKSLENVSFDVTQLNPEQIANWKTQIDDATLAGTSFYNVLNKIGLGADVVSDNTDKMSKTVKTASELFEGLFDVDFKQTQLNKSIEEMKVNAMEAISKIPTSFKGKYSYDWVPTEIPGGKTLVTTPLLSTVGEDVKQLQDDFIAGKITLDQYNQGLADIQNNPAVKEQIERVDILTEQQKKANEALEKQNEILNKTKTALSAAFSAALDSGKMEDFYSSMGKSIYDSAKENLIKAFAEPEIYKNMFKAYFDPQNMPTPTGDKEKDAAAMTAYMEALVADLNAKGFKINLGVEIPKTEMPELYGSFDDFVKRQKEAAQTAAQASADVGNVKLLGFGAEPMKVTDIIADINKQYAEGKIGLEEYNKKLLDVYTNPAVVAVTEKWRQLTAEEKKAAEEAEKFNKIQPTIKTIFGGQEGFKKSAKDAAIQAGQEQAADAIGKVMIGGKSVTDIIDEANKSLQAGTIDAMQYGAIMDSIYNNPDVKKLYEPWQKMSEAEKKAVEEADKAKAILEKMKSGLGSALDKFMQTGSTFDFAQSLGQSIYDNIYDNVKDAFIKSFSEAGLYKQIFDSYMQEHPIDFTGMTAEQAIQAASSYMNGVDKWLRGQGLDRTSIDISKTSTANVSGAEIQDATIQISNVTNAASFLQSMSDSLKSIDLELQNYTNMFSNTFSKKDFDSVKLSTEGGSITKIYQVTINNSEIYGDTYENVVKKVVNELQRQEGADI